MKRIGLISLALAGAYALAGCGSSVSPAAKSSVDASAAQIKAVEDNPNMPATQKEAIKARLEQQKKAGEAYASTQGH